MSKKKITKKPESDKNSKRVPIDWYIPDGTMTPFATNMIVQTIETEFKISFFEIKPVPRIDDSQPMPDKVRADLVASVIITPERLVKFVDALQKHIDKHVAKKKLIEDKS